METQDQQQAILKSVRVVIAVTIDYFIKRGWNDFTPMLEFEITIAKRRHYISLPVPLHEVVDDEDHIRKYSELYSRKVCEKTVQAHEADVDCKELYDAAYAILPTMFRNAIDLTPYSQVLVEEQKPSYCMRSDILNKLEKCRAKALKEGYSVQQFNYAMGEAISILKETTEHLK